MELGERMAVQVFASTEATASGMDITQAAIGGWMRDWVQHDARVCRAEKDFTCMASLAASKRGSEDDHISQVRQSHRVAENWLSRTPGYPPLTFGPYSVSCFSLRDAWVETASTKPPETW